ncbi:copper amine oxidase [Chlamydoabsidia padenii]|nr:copper amine oxidase [Chlamydoabsidia padenii]
MTNDHSHPLDPLNAGELEQVVSIVRCARSDDQTNYIFNSVSLYEPPKEQMLAHLGWSSSSSCQIEREALVVLLDRPSGKIHELVVSLTKQAITRWDQPVVKGQPGIHIDEMEEAANNIRTSPLVIEECAKLGITDMSMVYGDAWTVSRHKTLNNKRLNQVLLYLRTSKNDNQYAHPLDFYPIYDINKGEVLSIEHRTTPNNTRTGVPMTNRQYLPEQLGFENLRQDLKPIHITQPEGVSFTLTGRDLAWQKWGIYIGFSYREGLVLYNIRYNDGGKSRPLIYRLALAEMVVPYGHPGDIYNRKMALDVGEFNLGAMTNSLRLNCDCVGSIQYLDAVVCDMHGAPRTIANAICIHEEDVGILQKHTDDRGHGSYSARSRRLVISQIVTAANYDYGMYYYFYQDGTIQYEVKATGELNTHALAKDEDPRPYGTMISPQLNAQHHQHHFCARIDPMLDGINNSVAQVDVIPSELPTGHHDNDFGNAFYPVSTIFDNTDNAKTMADATKGRTWRIINENKLNPYSHEPVGYTLTSNHTPPLLPKQDSVVAQRATFATKTLWVTPYVDHQLYPAGFYPIQSHEPMGLPVWTRTNQSIRNKDVVLYFTFGLNHIVRVEDFPIMPVETCGYTLRPNGFFAGNPAIDVPPPSYTNKNKASGQCHTS